MNRRTLLLGAAALTVLAAMGPFRPALAETAAEAPQVPDLVIGNPDAKVTVVEYASYTCPHCATFHARVFKDLKANYIDTGKIKFVYREVFFDRYGLWAAMVARCGGEMRYFGIQDMLYAEQAAWSGAGGATDVVGALRKVGLKAGLTSEALDACLQDGAMAEAMVAKFQADTTADGIDSTPSFVINGKKYSNMNYADFAKLLDGLLAE